MRANRKFFTALLAIILATMACGSQTVTDSSSNSGEQVRLVTLVPAETFTSEGGGWREITGYEIRGEFEIKEIRPFGWNYSTDDGPFSNIGKENGIVVDFFDGTSVEFKTENGKLYTRP